MCCVLCVVRWSCVWCACVCPRRLLEKELDRWSEKQEQAERKVEQYASIGLGFEAVVEEYAQLCNAITHKEWSLKQLGSDASMSQ